MIDGEKRIGTVTRVTASSVDLNLPHSLAASGRRGTARGTVGDFVFIDCDEVAILGRILEVSVPERTRPTLERQTEQEAVVEPVGRVQLLATVDKTCQTVVRGVMSSPRIGDGVFAASGTALSQAIQSALVTGVDVEAGATPLVIELGAISGVENSTIALPPEKLFGRHCGIFGATGGGKSWTLAKLASEVGRLGGKAIIFDPTGEFSGKFPHSIEYAFSRSESRQTLVRFPSDRLTELSLFALFRPTGQSQAPAMQEAVRSLRLARALYKASDLRVEVGDQANIFSSDNFGDISVQKNGTIKKADQPIGNFAKAFQYFRQDVESEYCDFDINLLAEQIQRECLRPSTTTYGQTDKGLLGYCMTLILRIRNMLLLAELRCIFGAEGLDFCVELEKFFADGKQNVCLVSFKNVSFSHNAREILLNSIGEYMLRLARDEKFAKKPLICFLDEAHQFIGRSAGDEVNRVSLDAFGLLAKEGRKYGLTTVFATQRPRDIPQDILSQLGTLFVHRLTNERDRETIERACGDLDRSAAAFIPSLSQGEAIVLGPDLPTALPIQSKLPGEAAVPSPHDRAGRRGSVAAGAGSGRSVARIGLVV